MIDYQFGKRRLDFVIENHTQWIYNPSEVPCYATSGVFTTLPAPVAAKPGSDVKILGVKISSAMVPEAPAGTIQEKAGATDGIVGVICYEGPDGAKIVTYAQVPRKGSADPVVKACRDLISCSRMLITTLIDILVRSRPGSWSRSRRHHVAGRLEGRDGPRLRRH